ncbi:coiled-coil domain-containing protein [Stieleria varia]|nr:hypothetical protein [Stieleria varia]
MHDTFDPGLDYQLDPRYMPIPGNSESSEEDLTREEIEAVIHPHHSQDQPVVEESDDGKQLVCQQELGWGEARVEETSVVETFDQCVRQIETLTSEIPLAESPSAEKPLAGKPLADGSQADFLVRANSHMLAEVMDQLAMLRETVDYIASTQAIDRATAIPANAMAQIASSYQAVQSEPQEESYYEERIESATETRLSELQLINEQLNQDIVQMRGQLALMEQQNRDLASQVAGENVRRTVSESGGAVETLSWEQRKARILEQMEEDSFCAETFLDELQGKVDREAGDVIRRLESPVDYVMELQREIEDLRDQLNRQKQAAKASGNASQRSTATAVNTEAFAAAIDADEVIQAERAKLRKLQTDWEERFRETEIATSLERAKLSRERQQLEQDHGRLQEQLAQLNRRLESAESGDTTPSRRWLAKLGLNEDEN